MRYNRGGAILTCAALIYGVTSLLASQIWIFDLLTPFRPQMLIVGLIAILLTAGARQKAWFMAAIAALLLNMAPMAWRLIAMPSRHALYASQIGDGQTVSLLAANVLSSNTRYNDVADMLETENADIVVLTEITPKWGREMERLAVRYPYHYALPRADNFGVMVFAKRPFVTTVHTVGAYKLPLLGLTFDNMTVLCAHPYPPLGFAGSIENAIYLEHLAGLVNSADRPVLVAGDMNATLWSSSLRPLARAGLDRSNALGWAYTWPTGNPFMAIQIDHIFSKNVRSGHFRVLPADGSDHFPVRADLKL